MPCFLEGCCDLGDVLMRRLLKTTLYFLALSWTLSFTPSAFAAAPMLERLEPRGAQRGSAVKLTLTGTGLTYDAEILTTLPAGITHLTASKEKGRAGRELPFLLEIAPDAPIDSFPIRVQTKGGLSNILLFTVGAFPETAEEEAVAEIADPLNDSWDKAQLVETPLIVNGTILAGDRDFYRLRAKKGERLVIEVEARRIGSALDPSLRLTDAAGKVVARNEDAPGIGIDARVDVRFPDHGDYYVEVRDARFGTLVENFYRLKIGDFSYADGIFPLGARKRGSTEFEAFGGNLDKPVKIRHDPSQHGPSPDNRSAGDRAEWTSVVVPGKPGALPMRLPVSADPEVREAINEKSGELPGGAILNGRILHPGEVDRYRLSVAPGESWRFELKAASTGLSPLFALLTIHDGNGNKLASAGDLPGKGTRYEVLASSGEAGADPFLALTVPDGTREFQITVEDLVGRGGPEYGYRLLAKKEPADFELTIATPYLNIPRQGTTALLVTIGRRGYQGAIEIEIPNLPDDIILRGGHVAPAPAEAADGIQARQATLTLSPKPGAPGGPVLNLDVWGKGMSGDTVIRRRARASGMVTSLKPSQPSFLFLPETLDAPWLNLAVPAAVVPPEAAVLELLTASDVRLIVGMTREIEWSFHARRPGIRPPKTVDARAGIFVPIKRGEREDYADHGSMTLITTETFGGGTEVTDLPVKFDVVLSGQIEVDGRKQVLYSPAITFEVVLGYEVDLPAELTLEPGRDVQLAGKVTREPGFDSPINVQLAGLPAGVSCTPAGVTSASDVFELSCSAEADALPGEYKVKITASSALPGSEKKNVPLKMKPIEARLLVRGESPKVAQAGR
jgi:hypothetical protein